MNGAVSSAANPSGVQGVCPTGWHIPSDAEWTSLENFLVANDYNYDGTTTGNKYAKSLASTSSWTSSSTIGAVGNTDYPTYRNKSGFSAIPGGFRYYYGSFYYIGSNGCWWSSTEGNATSAWIRSMSYESGNVYRVYDSKCDGFSVRCLRDLSVDIKEINKIEEINLYPNPATNNLTIETNKNATIEIINIQGQIIKTLSTLSTQTKLNISNLTNGVFTIRIKTDKEIIVKKLIKQ